MDQTAFQGVLKGFSVLVNQQVGTDGFLWTKQHGPNSMVHTISARNDLKGILVQIRGGHPFLAFRNVEGHDEAH